MSRIVSMVVLMLTAAAGLQAQPLKKKFVTPLNERLSNAQMEWVAMDRDTLLDLVIAGVGTDGQWKIQPYQNQGTASYFVRKNVILSGMKSGYAQVTDWNADNKMDLMVAGRTLINTDALFCFTGNDQFGFTKIPDKILEHASSFRIADLNNDAAPDLVTWGSINDIPFIRVYQTDKGIIRLRNTINGVHATDLVVSDMNRDGTRDLVVSGRDSQNKPVTDVYFGAAQFRFRKMRLALPIDGAMSVADLNDDGLPEVTAMSAAATRSWVNEIDTLKPASTSEGLSMPYVFGGDMTSDGQSDHLLFGKNDTGKRSNTIVQSNGVRIAVDTTGVIIERMGDQDRDGDLDLVQLIDSIGTQWLKYYENTTPQENHRPKSPTNAFAVSAYKKTVIFWDAPDDDLTARPSLTYDVWIGTASNTVLAASYDRVNGRRMAVRHGNAGSSTSVIVRDLPDDTYYYGVQSVDNAYNGSYGFGQGTVLPCFTLKHEQVQSCKGEVVVLDAGGEAHWFSTTRGRLATTKELRFTAASADTVFAVVPQSIDCARNKVFVIQVNDGPGSSKQTIYACKDKTLTLEIPPGWSTITWNTVPPVVNKSSIDYLVTGPATITATAQSQACSYQMEFTIRLSQPTVAIEGEGFQILKGASVQLEGSGNAATWSWSPPAGISNPAIRNPLATPVISTEYTLTGTDTVGCTASARIQVTVQENAFVPNLFTPNGDGKNDNLLIYGLTSATRFNFRIFNREGSLVYETKDPAQATAVGWNGTVQGTRQPSGMYYWRIDGETATGEKLLLNGKTNGSILLVH